MKKSNKPNRHRPKKAKVYLWPNLTEDQVAEVEADCVYAGYTAKRKVKVGRVTCYEVS